MTMTGPESIFRNGRARRRTDMERLTTYRADGRAAIANNDGATPLQQTMKIPNIIDRLAAYEETGLEPEEIEKLKGEVFGLRLDKQNLEQVKQKYGEAREAICTHCMDVPCQGESCYWWQGPEEG